MPAKLKLEGQLFGMLSVKAEGERSSSGRVRWLCVCKCGAEKFVNGHHLKSGAIRSCGSCAHREVGAPWNIKHGDTAGGVIAPEYTSWVCMILRCTDVKNHNYPNYGGRGISVCDRWQSEYSAFLADMGRKPTSKHSIDRVNNNGNYEPGNCRWATMVEQCANRRPRRRSAGGTP